MKFKRKELYGYEIEREAGESVMYVNYMNAGFVPSIVDHPEVMARTIDLLIKNQNVSRIVFVQQRNYNYNFYQTALLLEISQLYNYLIKQERVLNPERLIINNQQIIPKRHSQMNYLLNLLKTDPIYSYLETKRILREERIALDMIPIDFKADQMNYIRLLEKITSLISNLRIIKEVQDKIESYKPNREIYRQFFRPDIIPNFTFTRLSANLPDDAEMIDQYSISFKDEEATVTILKKQDESKYIYHITPPEYILDEDHHILLNLARNVLIEHRPKAEEFTDPERTRQVFFNVSRDLLQELSTSKGIKISYTKLNSLANILVRYTIGFGIIELLLQDEKIQDIVLNAPISLNSIFVRHQEYDECVTNIIPSHEDAQSWAAKFRMISGRPLDEANPVLDTDLSVGNARARVAVIQQPLSPSGIAYAFRRHREEPWTLPLFIQQLKN